MPSVRLICTRPQSEIDQPFPAVGLQEPEIDASIVSTRLSFEIASVPANSIVWPTLQMFLISFTDAPLIGPGEWVGIDNYTRLDNDPRFRTAVWNTAYFVLMTVAPGTLVEEAAIRRSLLVAEQINDQDRFEMLVRQYLARFRHSIYAGNFRYRFAAALSRSPILDDPAQFPRLDALLEQLGPLVQVGGAAPAPNSAPAY